MTSLARSPMMRRIVEEQWLSLDVFHDRRHLFRDALSDHRKRRYRPSILTLLPHPEGIAYAAFAPGSESSNPAVAISMAGLDYDELVADGLLDAITVLYTRMDNFTLAPGADPLNRHLILHGRFLGFASEVNSTRLLWAFDQWLRSSARPKRKG